MLLYQRVDYADIREAIMGVERAILFLSYADANTELRDCLNRLGWESDAILRLASQLGYEFTTADLRRAVDILQRLTLDS